MIFPASRFRTVPTRRPATTKSALKMRGSFAYAQDKFHATATKAKTKEPTVRRLQKKNGTGVRNLNLPHGNRSCPLVLRGEQGFHDLFQFVRAFHVFGIIVRGNVKRQIAFGADAL